MRFYFFVSLLSIFLFLSLIELWICKLEFKNCFWWYGPCGKGKNLLKKKKLKILFTSFLRIYSKRTDHPKHSPHQKGPKTIPMPYLYQEQGASTISSRQKMSILLLHYAFANVRVAQFKNFRCGKSSQFCSFIRFVLILILFFFFFLNIFWETKNIYFSLLISLLGSSQVRNYFECRYFFIVCLFLVLGFGTRRRRSWMLHER